MRAQMITAALTGVLALAPLTASAQRPSSIPTDVLGRLEHVEPGSRTLYFRDGRIVTLDPGATIWVDGREVPIETLRRGMTVVIRGGQPPAAQAGTVGGPPSATGVSSQAAQAVPGHPPVTASGVVARVDEDARTVTFQDGRTLKLGPGSRVWESSEVGDIQPGERAMVESAQPAGYGTGAGIPADRMRMGRVVRVDDGPKMVLLDNGTWVVLSPTTTLKMNGRDTVTTLQQGDEVVVVITETPPGEQALTAPSAMPGAVAQPSSPRATPQRELGFQGNAVRAEEIHIIRRPQSP